MPGPSVVRIDDRLLLVSTPLPTRRLTSFGLTDAEREVARLAIEGRSNGEIARLRACSERTVANQLAAAYVKAGVSGRRALRALVHLGD